MYERQKESLAAYYQKITLQKDRLADDTYHKQFFDTRRQIIEEFETFYAQNPDTPFALFKSRMHTLMAKYCRPVIFEGNPFFFEFGYREAQSWGISEINPIRFLKQKISIGLHDKFPILTQCEKEFEPVFDLAALGICSASSSFDGDHHTLGYTNLFQHGLSGLMEKLQNRLDTFEENSEEDLYCRAMLESCHAVLTIAEKFADAAREKLAGCANEKQKQYLELLAETAGKIPAMPPQTFYEGLAMLLFTREAAATLEEIGISQLGHVDRLLGPLYEQDLLAGRITEEEARELISIWMLHTDIKFDLAHNSWPETSTCIQLGGCDRDGQPVYNTVTRMFIEEHHRLGLINPKLNCRYRNDSPTEYLTAAGKAMLAGHNNFVMINDDIIISGLQKSGVALEDARMYVSGGCQETMIEGFGHTEGVAFYASMPRVLDLFLQGDAPDFVIPCGEPETYEAFYESFITSICTFFTKMITWRNMRQSYYRQLTPSPFFSATQTGCIENGRDYSHGGAKYNFSTISLIGLGTVADSLFAIKTMVYEQQKVSLPEFVRILSANWEGHRDLQKEIIALPKYGHNHPEADGLANRFLQDFTKNLYPHKNERGGNYIPSLFVYYHFETFSHVLRATPDGRNAFELISAGAAPGQLREIKDVTMPVKSMQHMDFTSCGGGSAVLDVKLPLSRHMTPELFASFIRACGQYHCPTIQPNVVSQEELLDAKLHPEKHQSLIVRICGLSAFFVALTPEVQDEIIARNLYQM